VPPPVCVLLSHKDNDLSTFVHGFAWLTPVLLPFPLCGRTIMQPSHWPHLIPLDLRLGPNISPSNIIGSAATSKKEKFKCATSIPNPSWVLFSPNPSLMTISTELVASLCAGNTHGLRVSVTVPNGTQQNYSSFFLFILSSTLLFSATGRIKTKTESFIARHPYIIL
jgi:hypothetical protein